MAQSKLGALETVLDYLKAARYYLLNYAPYLAKPAIDLQFVPRRGLETVACDSSWRMYYDPETLPTWDIPEVAASIEHELWHLLDKHFIRAEKMGVTESTKEVWNIAGDIAIHSIARLERELDRPHEGRGAWTPQTTGLPAGLPVELYYQVLLNAQAMQRSGKFPEGVVYVPGKQGKAGSVEAAPPGTSDKNKIPNVDQMVQQTKGGQPKIGHGKCGSCATNIPEKWEDTPTGTVTEGDVDKKRRRVALAIKEWLSQQKSIGSGPGNALAQFADQVLAPPKIRWERQLRAALRKAVTQAAGAFDYSRRRVSRRQAAQPYMMLPGTYKPVPEVAVVVDTSGSMNKEDLAQALSEVQGILKATGVHQGVRVFATDAAVGFARQVFRPSQIQLTGGGGTDMRVGIRAAMQSKPEPHVVVVLTDGYTPWPSRPLKGAKLIIGIIAEEAGHGLHHMPLPETPSWAKTIPIGR